MRAWRQPDRAGLYRRSQRRLALSRPVQGRLRQPADLDSARGRAQTQRLLHRGGGALRPAGQQTFAPGVRELPPLPARRDAPADARAGAGRSGGARLRARLARGRRDARPSQFPPAHLWPRCGIRARPSRSPAVSAGLLSPQPAKHLYRKTDGSHVGRRFQPGQGTTPIISKLRSAQRSGETQRPYLMSGLSLRSLFLCVLRG